MKILKLSGACLGLLFFSALSYALEIDKSALDFGTKNAGETAKLFFNLKNSSLKTIQTGIRPSCECITAKPSMLRLEPGASKEIELTVDTKGYAGLFNKDVYVQSSDNSTPYTSLKVTGSVISGASTGSQSSVNKPAEISGNKIVKIEIFGSPGCGVCKKIEDEIIPAYEARYGVKAEVKQLSLDNPKNYEKLSGIEKRLNKPLSKIPAMYAGGSLYGGKNEILVNLDAIFKNPQYPAGIMENMASPENSGALSAAEKLKIFPVIFAGIVDSINPCAFATIVFFLSYMSLVLKKSRIEIFLAGLVFITGVFLTYFLIGVGIFKAVLGISGLLKYSKILYLIIGVFVLFLSARHFYEAVVLKKTGKLDDDEVKLKLPGWIRNSIEKLITEFTGLRFILPFVFLLAVIITLLELVCTGQVYLPAIIYLTSLAAYRLQAYVYLVLYCLLFVAPLIIIFVMYYFGLTTLTLKKFFRNNIAAMKITMAVFFLTIAVFMIAEGVK